MAHTTLTFCMLCPPNADGIGRAGYLHYGQPLPAVDPSASTALTAFRSMLDLRHTLRPHAMLHLRECHPTLVARVRAGSALPLGAICSQHVPFQQLDVQFAANHEQWLPWTEPSFPCNARTDAGRDLWLQWFESLGAILRPALKDEREVALMALSTQTLTFKLTAFGKNALKTKTDRPTCTV